MQSRKLFLFLGVTLFGEKKVGRRFSFIFSRDKKHFYYICYQYSDFNIYHEIEF